MFSASSLSNESSDEEETVSKDDMKNGGGTSFGKRAWPSFGGNEPQDATGSSQYPQFSDKSVKMMRAMGYKDGAGLGKEGQGRVDLIETSTQKGRSGLGMRLDELNNTAAQWNASMQVINVPEKISWLVNNDDSDCVNINRDQLDAWIKIGKKKLTIDDEISFCDKDVLLQILDCKTAFDNLGGDDMKRARCTSNPFETIKRNIFMNRAAVKMANMDAMFDFMFTKPLDEDGKPILKDNDLLYFADVCAGPGGFSEYVLWRKKWHAKGFGFTLRGDNEFKLDEFIAGTPETFDAYYGPKGDGDIYNPDNIEAFSDYVLKQTETGVHMMMADGGFSVDGEENIQEILSKRLYLCQIIVALNIVRTNGHFVTKLFDLFTPFSVGLLYLVYKCFKQICICKPNTSRPANSERYLVCKWKKADTGLIQRHLEDVNKAINGNKNPEIDTLELVSMETLQQDRDFFNYIYTSNNEIGKNQIAGLIKVAAFCKNRELNEPQQSTIKQRCLELWRLTESIRKYAPKGSSPEQYLSEFFPLWEKEQSFFSSEDRNVGVELPKSFRKYTDGWYFVPLANVENHERNIRTFFLGKGGKDVFKYIAGQRSWKALKEVHLELPPKTLLYGEIVKELQGEGKSQITITGFHIIDGLVLGGEEIHQLPLQDRLLQCQKFAKALNKPLKSFNNADDSPSISIPIRCKRLYALHSIERFFDSLENVKLKNGPQRLSYRLRNSINSDRIFVPMGLLFISEVHPNYMRLMSSKQKQFYYFNVTTGESKFPDRLAKEKVLGSFRDTYEIRVAWKWTNVLQVMPEPPVDRYEGCVYRTDFTEFLRKLDKH